MPKIKTGTAAILLMCVAGTVSAQGLEFRLQRGPLDLPGRVVPVLEGRLKFDERRPDSLRGVPSGLSQVGYAEVGWSPTVSVLALGGRLPDGTRIIVLDRNGNHDMSDDQPVSFARQDGIDQARVEISYRHVVGERPVTGTTTLVLLERTPGKVDYHFDELWETAVQVGGETLRVALQRWPTLFLDVQFDRTYQKPFFPDKEILALGGRFFRVHIDWPSERLRLEETDQRPVDAGQAAPDFDAEIVGTGRHFNLAEQRGRVVVLTFWSPLCSGSKAEAARYHQLAESFAGDPRFRFVAVTRDAAALAGYLTGHRHAFDHVVSTDLWTTYGVTAPFVTFVIDGRTRIARRAFGFDPALPSLLTRLAENRRESASLTVR